jgi:NAD(P)-dependent dehydrogenase (short-subunit alcohol dehydrogenase family)
MPRRVLILGASSTLGSATAKLLHSAGAQVWLTYARASKESSLRGIFSAAPISQVNVLDPGDILRLRDDVRLRWGALDGLVCAFGAVRLEPLNRASDDGLAGILHLNLEAVLRVCRDFLPLLLKGENAAVVLFSSTMGLVGAPAMSAYAASKAGVRSLAQSLALEWAPRRIRVNAVAPGVVPSPLVDEMFSHLTPEEVEVIRQRHPLGFGEPADVAHAVSFLLSPMAKWITGVVLPVDGGYTAQ